MTVDFTLAELKLIKYLMSHRDTRDQEYRDFLTELGETNVGGKVSVAIDELGASPSIAPERGESDGFEQLFAQVIKMFGMDRVSRFVETSMCRCCDGRHTVQTIVIHDVRRTLKWMTTPKHLSPK